MTWTDWVLPAGFFAISFFLGQVFCSLVKRTGIVDAPDGERKTQSAPVPRLGGVAVFGACAVGALFSFGLMSAIYGLDAIGLIADVPRNVAQMSAENWSLIIFVGSAFLIGLWDDLTTANTKAKLAILTVIAILAASVGLSVDQFPGPWGEVTLPAFLVVGSAAWLLVMTNATNFMDGSNGLAIGTLAIMFAGLALISSTVGAWGYSVWWFVLFGAVAAFLVQNLNGDLYVGDAGALGLGALFAALAVFSGLSVWTIATLAIPFLVDVLMTLIWRAKHRRSWLDAHLDHAYQKLIAHGWPHLDVAVLYWGLAATSGVLAYIAAQAGGEASFIVFWTLWIALSVIWVWHRRSPERRDLGG